MMKVWRAEVRAQSGAGSEPAELDENGLSLFDIVPQITN